MRQITELAWITKTKAKLYLDDELYVVVTKSDILEYGFTEDALIEDAVIDTFYQEVMLKRAKQKALSLLGGKDYTEHELYTKLQREYQSAALAKSAVDYVKSYHYLDDERFAQNYVNYHCQGQSRQQILQKLRSKGLSDDLIEDAMNSDALDDSELLKQIIQKKYPYLMYYPPEKKKKVMNALLRKGFRYHDIQSYLSDVY